MPELVPVLRKEDIDRQVAMVAGKISADYKGRDLVVIGVLKGAFVFLSDLVRQLCIPLKIDFVQVSSYGDATCSSGNICLVKDIGVDIENRHVLVVEDIVDTGLTLSYLLEHIRSFRPASVKVCSFIHKSGRRKVAVPVDYCCHAVEEGFLVGYGLDYAEDYRHLPELYEMKE